jgi:hypothetical protein
MINLTTPPSMHIDSKDFNGGFAAVFPFGEYKEGYLEFPELKIAFDVRPGDLIVFQGHLLTHGNSAIIGQRGSCVLTTNNTLYNYDS